MLALLKGRELQREPFLNNDLLDREGDSSYDQYHPSKYNQSDGGCIQAVNIVWGTSQRITVSRFFATELVRLEHSRCVFALCSRKSAVSDANAKDQVNNAFFH